MSSFVLAFKNIDRTKIAIAGGKGANLGELSKIEGISVPGGFCVSAQAFKKIIGKNSKINALLKQLSLVKSKEQSKISELSSEIRNLIEATTIPQNLRDEIISCLCTLGKENSYAVRSSATAEDLPAASFAGQQDTYLNVAGTDAILKHVSKCWASL